LISFCFIAHSAAAIFALASADAPASAAGAGALAAGAVETGALALIPEPSSAALSFLHPHNTTSERKQQTTVNRIFIGLS
jgi:hypothetical protein